MAISLSVVPRPQQKEGNRMGTKLWECLDHMSRGRVIKNVLGLHDEADAHCAMGFLNVAHTGEWLWNHPLTDDYLADTGALAEVAREQFPERTRAFWGQGTDISAVVAFNNHPATTPEEVQTVFHKAALRRDEILCP